MSSIPFPYGSFMILLTLVLAYIYLRRKGDEGEQRNIFFPASIFFLPLALVIAALQWFAPWF